MLPKKYREGPLKIPIPMVPGTMGIVSDLYPYLQDIVCTDEIGKP
jgi:hypothetical protein